MIEKNNTPLSGQILFSSLNEDLEESQSNRRSIIDIDSVSKTYKRGRKKIEVLHNINLRINEGEIVAIVGSSGSGKSTLLQIIGGLDKPTAGKVVVDDRDIGRLSDSELSSFRNQTIGFIFQFFYLQPFLKLRKNIEVAAMPGKLKRQERRSRTVELASSVGLSDRLDHYPSELSGGQIQRAAIARALLNKPRIILADEPTGNLDTENTNIVIELLKSLSKIDHTTVVIATHDPLIAAKADRVITIQEGSLR